VNGSIGSVRNRVAEVSVVTSFSPKSVILEVRGFQSCGFPAGLQIRTLDGAIWVATVKILERVSVRSKALTQLANYTKNFELGIFLKERRRAFSSKDVL
jgi:hypothetical protein